MKKSNEKGNNLYFYPISIDYKVDRSKKANINIFGFSKDLNKTIVLDTKFEPYFWALPKKEENHKYVVEKIKKIKVKNEDYYISPKKTSLEIKNINNEQRKIIKIACNSPEEIIFLRNFVKKLPEIEDIFEADINFYKRYLIDSKLKINLLSKAKGKDDLVSSPNVSGIFEATDIKNASSDSFLFPRMAGFDIEVLADKNFPVPEKNPIVMVSVYSSTGLKKVITWKKFEDAPAFVEFVDGESELIEEFIKTINSLDLQIIFGYNSNKFDFDFLIERAKKYGIEIDLGWRNTVAKKKRIGMSKMIYFDGLSHIDLYSFIKNIVAPDLKTNRLDLDSVAFEVLGENKIKIENFPDILRDAWESANSEKMTRICEYNLKDSILALGLGEKMISSIIQLSKLTNLPIQDVSCMSSWQMVEFKILRHAAMAGFINPNVPEKNIIEKRLKNTFSGGFVIEPKPGLYEGVAAFDFRSLYPSIIIAHNIDPTTRNCKCCELHGGHKIDGDWYCSKKKGIISGLLEELIDKKNRVSEILKKTSQDNVAYSELKAKRYALKLLANSFYGYMAFSGARWYCLECAESVAALGREYIHKIIKEANKFGFDVIYGDTDGVFLKFDKKTEKDADKFLKLINAVLPYPIRLEFDGLFKKALFLEKKSGEGGAKKKYALLDKNDSVILKGVEAIRGDWSIVAKETQKFAIESILKTGNMIEAEKYVKQIITSIKNRTIPLEKLKISVKITRPLSDYKTRGPHVAAAELARKKGISVHSGFLTSYIIKKGEGRLSDRVVLFDDAKKSDYDPDYYINNQILKVVGKLFETFGYSETEIKSGQTKLI